MSEQTLPEQVVDRKSFGAYIDSLINDFNNNSEQWENVNIRDFLEALSRYTEDVQGYYDNMNLLIDADKPTWRVFADILKGATMYE